jgi:two-component system, cell cycle sensor histidine kinase and response regulator CckA
VIKFALEESFSNGSIDMKTKDVTTEKYAALRLKAEQELESMLTKLDSLPHETALDIKRLVHELQVHQIELEMQNDELRNAQQEIESSRKKFSDLYNFAPVGYFTFDSEGRILEVNLTAVQLLGVDRSSLLDTRFYSHIDKNDCDIFYWHLAKVCETRAPHSCEIKLKKSNGAEFYARLDSNIVQENDDSISQCRTAITDISEVKHAETALKESEEKYRHLIENSNDAIYVLYNRRFELVNKKFKDIFGVTSADVNKSKFDFTELVAPKSRPFIEDRMKRMQQGEVLEPRYEFLALTKAGKELEVEVCVSYIKYKGGKATQGILRDVSERKRLEEQLQQAQKMEAIGKLAGGIAHDFNNLLTAILGNAELLLLNINATDPQSEDVKEIQKAAHRAALLTKQLLAFARRQPLILKVINLNKIISNMKNMLMRLIGENIELVIELEPTLSYIKADLGQVSQLIMNLVINSREAISENGKIIISTRNITVNNNNIKLFPNSQPGNFVCLSIEDNGGGIEEAVIDHIFEPFFTTKGFAQSSGLGLAVVYGVVRQHGGWIQVSSEQDRGSMFKIFLPVTEELPIDKTDENLSISELEGYGERILLVEDEEMVRNYIVKILRNQSYVVFEASDAQEALKIFKKEQGEFDLIFSDVILPDMTGIKLVAELLAEKPHIPILLGSGYADHESEWPVIQEKGYRFIGKPYSLPDLLRNIRQLLTIPAKS